MTYTAVDPKAAGTGATASGTALIGWLSLNDVALIVGIVATVITTAAYVWSVRKTRKDRKQHYNEIEKIERDK